MMPPDEVLDEELKKSLLLTTVDAVYNWGRQVSMWPVMFGLACCALEMIASVASRYDASRFGMELFRASPRQADLMIVAGTITQKMAPQVLRIYAADGRAEICAGDGHLRHLRRHLRPLTPCCRALTRSSRSMFTCRAARPDRRH